MRILCVILGIVGIALTACRPGGESGQAKSPRAFHATGIIKSVEPHDALVIQHSAISNYMPAMTMEFRAKNSAEIRGLQAGDTINFQLVVTSDDGWIEHIEKVSGPMNAPPLPPEPAASAAPGEIVVMPPELEEGDAVPDYRLTNELGRAFNLSSLKGSVVAYTFFFTRCPFPTACPLLSSKFSEVARKLPQASGAPANWHLLSISFDPTNDTPATLRSYAGRFDYDPAHWNFVTGGIKDISDLADRSGEVFDNNNGVVNHNFRTVILDAKGRVRRIIQGNAWNSDELVQEMVKAAR